VTAGIALKETQPGAAGMSWKHLLCAAGAAAALSLGGAAAAVLREHPELVDKLNWHLAVIASYRSNVRVVDSVARDLLGRLGND